MPSNTESGRHGATEDTTTSEREDKAAIQTRESKVDRPDLPEVSTDPASPTAPEDLNSLGGPKGPWEPGVVGESKADRVPFGEFVDANRPGGERDEDGFRKHRTPAGHYPDAPENASTEEG